MKIAFRMIAAVLLLHATPALSRPVPRTPPDVNVSTIPPSLDAYIEATRKQWNVPGLAIAIVKDGRVLVAKGYGVRRQGGTAPVDADTVFNVASLTKSFTSAAAAMLVGEGKLNWDDRVRDWLPEFDLADPWVAGQVTLRDLLAHRTGLEQGDVAWSFTHIGRAEMIRRLRYLPQRAPFRSRFVYSNSLYAVAGEVIAHAASTSYERLIADRLLTPLGMRDASIAILDPTKGNIAYAHAVIDGQGQLPISYAWDLNTAPAGGLNASANDMAIWMRFQLGEGMIDGRRLIAADALRETHEPQIVIPTTPAFRAGRGVEHFAGYGMGWQVMDYRGHPAIWHSGSAAGMPVYMTLLPKDGLGIVVMLNSSPPVPLHGSIAARIADTLLGLPVRENAADLAAMAARADQQQRDFAKAQAAERIPGAKPALPPIGYAATYDSKAYGEVIVRAAGGRLSLQMGAAGEIADLEHWHGEVWRIDWRVPFLRDGFDSWITFRIGENGRAGAATVKIGRDRFDVERRS